MKLAILAAMTDDWVIGKQGRLPWRLPEDLARFKQLTLGHPLIMGRKTWESLPKKPLPGRTNVVLSRQADYVAPGALVTASLAEALSKLGAEAEPAFVIGGAELFQEALPLADSMLLTLIHHPFEGDVFFPEFSMADWQLLSRTSARSGGEAGFDYEFVDFGRAQRS